MNRQLAARVAVVTGAASGLGAAIADAFRAAGADVVRCDYVVEAGSRRIDVRDADTVAELMADVVGEFGRIDVLVNSAGIAASEQPSLEIGPVEWQEIVATNLIGTWNCCQAAITHMLPQQSGNIINISSRLAFSAGGPGRAAYVASKAAVSNLTRQLAYEYGRDGIRTNAICPGFISHTGAEITQHADRIITARQQTPWPRLGAASDVADAAVYLASERSGFINGHNLIVDGGASVTP